MKSAVGLSVLVIILLGFSSFGSSQNADLASRIRTLDKQLTDFLAVQQKDQLPTQDWRAAGRHFRTQLGKLKAEARASHEPDFRAKIRPLRRKIAAIARLAMKGSRQITSDTEISPADSCADAPTIGDGTYRSYAVDATHDGSSGCDPGGMPPDVWYRYRAPSGGKHVAMVSSWDFDSVVSLHSGGSCGNESNEIACNDDCGLLDEEIASCPVFYSTQGADYWLRISSYYDDEPIGNFTLHIGEPSVISGRAVDAQTGQPFDDAEVDIYESDGSVVAYGYTDSNGYYSVNNLPEGTYFAQTLVGLDYYVDETFNGIADACWPPNSYCATPIIVTGGRNTQNINFALTKGGDFTGQVMGGGHPLWYGNVDIVDESGREVASEILTGYGFESPYLLPGTYYAYVNLYWGGYLEEVYDNIPCKSYCHPTQGTPINVVPGVTLSGIDFDLERGGTITGQVLTETGAPVHARVTVENQDGATLKYCYTNDAGGFSCNTIPTGSYYLRTLNWENHLDEYYDNVPCSDWNGCTSAGATSVAVQEDTVTSGIDFHLSETGGISGYIRDAATGIPLQAAVSIYSLNTSRSFISDSNGFYQANGLPPGNYFVIAWNYGYVGELYNGFLCQPTCQPSSGTPVPVVIGSVTNNINLDLGRGGMISGTITDALIHQPIPNVELEFYDSNFTRITETRTDATGQYLVSGFVTGSYFTRTSARGYQNEIYDDIPCTGGSCHFSDADATPIPVTINQTTSGIDFQLNPLPQFTGHVLEKGTLKAIRGVTVSAYDSTGKHSGGGSSGSSGQFRFSVRPGTYYLRTEQYYDDDDEYPRIDYIAEIYDDIVCPDCSATIGNPITVDDWGQIATADFVLELGGSISGTANEDVSIEAIDSWGRRMNADASSGIFRVRGLPTGKYFAKTSNNMGLVDELYEGIDCPLSSCDPSNGSPIEVEQGRETKIHFELRSGGGIAGRVTDAATGKGTGSVRIEARNIAGMTMAQAYPDWQGNYRVEGLPPGNYYVLAIGYGTYLNQLYPGISCPQGVCDLASGQRVNVRGPAITYGVDFRLRKGGSISGFVSDAVTGQPVPFFDIDVFDSQGHNVTYDYGASGLYKIEGLPAGNYFLATKWIDGYVDELFDNVQCPGQSCNVLNGTMVSVFDGEETRGIDLALTPGGSIEGDVIDAATDLRVPYSIVNLYNSSGNFVYSTSTFSYGHWDTDYLPAGTYYAISQADECYDATLFDDLPCPQGSCDPTAGTSITVVAGESTGLIDLRVGSTESLFCDNFTDSRIDSRWKYSDVRWQEFGGLLTGVSSAGKITAAASGAFTGCTNCSITTSFTTPGRTKRGTVTLLGWFQDGDNAIELVGKADSDQWILRQRSSGRIVAKEKATKPVERNQTYQIKMAFDGSMFHVYIDDFQNPLINMTPAAAVPNGTVGFQVENMIGSFGFIRVN